MPPDGDGPPHSLVEHGMGFALAVDEERLPSQSWIWQAAPGTGRCPAAGPLLLEQHHHGKGAEGRA